ncbi:MAG: hypothetical protein LBU69_03955 [Deltaproteobacteria bacterium]|jgi:hypothetical protein|nr:hypothetical protein [Deltaproteobacteria bacterium]
MASGVSRLRYGKSRRNRKPIFFLIVVLLLAVIGWFAWPMAKSWLNIGSSQVGAVTAPGGSSNEGSLAASPRQWDDSGLYEGSAQNVGLYQGDALAEAGVPQNPAIGDSSVRKVLDSVMASWVTALVKDDFTGFHAIISSLWQRKDSPAQLKASYGVLAPFKESLKLFPSRGKLVLLESRPFSTESLGVADGIPGIRDNLGPESPWLVRGEWRVNKTALGFTLVLNLENGQWRPIGLNVEIFN